MAKRMTTADVTAEATAGAAAAAPRRQPPPFKLPPVPGIELAGELWQGAAGRLVVVEGAAKHDGLIITLSRWVIRSTAFRADDKWTAESWEALRKLHVRHCKDAGKDPEDHPLVPIKRGTAPQTESGLAGCLEAKAGAWPFARTDVVFDSLEAANRAGLGGTFFRLYLSTDPEATGTESIRVVPDIICLNLGDPALLYPAETAGYLTDGRYVAIAPATSDVVTEAAAAVAAVAARRF